MCDAYNRQYGTNFIAAMPTNLYGPGDNYDPENSHVLPALIRRFHEAKVAGRESVTCWGSGNPLREFLYSDDLAERGMLAKGVLLPGHGPDIDELPERRYEDWLATVERALETLSFCLCQSAIADAVIDTIQSFQDGNLMNCVNLGKPDDGEAMTVTVRHYNRVGVLAGVLGTIRNAGLNVEDMENFVLQGRDAASAIIHVVGTIEPETVAQLERVDNVIAVSVSRR